MRNPEILAPAGSMEALLAALRCGADAVYVGAKAYSARSSAVNFDLPELEEAVKLCHLYGAKLHLAVNTLLTDSELDNFQGFIRQAVQCGIDACIVQDLGVLKIIRSMIPDLPLHASTQMSIHTPEGALQAKELGCSRIVLARELSCRDLEKICELPVETEVFVHGALCMSVSGQCSFSAIVGGRSANRGQCAQACRLPWNTPEGNYPAALSLKDVSLVKHVELLKKIGVDSFKIEGRMKRPEYVAAAVTALRMALDGQQPDMKVLQSVFSRSGFTDGYFTGKKQAMFGYRRKEDVLAGQQVFSSIQASYQKPRIIAELDFALQLQTGQPALLYVSDSDGNKIMIQGDIPEPAQKMPLKAEVLQKYLQKLGGTVYQCRSVRLNNQDNLILSASQCNALRRNAVAEMNALRQKKTAYQILEPPVLHVSGMQEKHSIQKRLHVRTTAQMQYALQTNMITCLPLCLAEICQPELSIWVESPRIIAHEAEYQNQLQKLYQKGFRHLLCHNLADIRIGREIGFVLHGGFGLNCTNSVTAYSLQEQGLQDATGSYELRAKTLQNLNRVMPCSAYIYGRLPMMLFRLCPIQAQDGCRHKHCFLTDRTGRKFPLLCNGDYQELLNSEILFLADKLSYFAGLDGWDFYFTDESPEQIQEVLQAYDSYPKQIPANRTNGLYLKGGLV